MVANAPTHDVSAGSTCTFLKMFFQSSALDRFYQPSLLGVKPPADGSEISVPSLPEFGDESLTLPAVCTST